ncbi:MAG: hypothetical protein UW63_C0093G0003 [Candidatus Uhrbacteria bacterium GW2011_GWF2_44_350]|uniref:Uncharacterized protein n=1 Tax=Candidatus Uhrbacteria bacterium GW2011_GWF2_44_350 TaxID=1619000 RepID=A0A0G1J958_9BACT|nr:MAG: hypothetical protein UW63_C0093G0003 [Candidatus Uhrbacteria bacterium GW2011_GWF2_44_350]
MTAITHQREANRLRIVEMALTLFDKKSQDEKRVMFELYVNHIAVNYTVNQQKDWMGILEKALKGGGK